MKSFDLGTLEHLILNYSIKDRSFWLKVFESIKPSYFEKDQNKKVFSFFKEYFRKYNQLPDYQIANNELKDVDSDLLVAIYDLPPEDTKDYIYDKTLDFISENMMRSALMEAIDYLEKKDFNKIYESVKKVLEFSLDTSLGLKLADIDTRYEKIKALERERVSTGYGQLDAILRGGWAKKEAYACAAPPGIGKCATYETEIEIEIDTEDPAFQKIVAYLSMT